jgi:hypothetical protein
MSDVNAYSIYYIARIRSVQAPDIGGICYECVVAQSLAQQLSQLVAESLADSGE